MIARPARFVKPRRRAAGAAMRIEAFAAPTRTSGPSRKLYECMSMSMSMSTSARASASARGRPREPFRIAPRARATAVAFAAIAAVLYGAGASPALAAKAAVLTGTDVLARPGDTATLRFKVERNSLIRYDIRGAPVEFRFNGALIGTAVSAADGHADLRVSVGLAPGDYEVAGKVAPGASWWSPEARLFLAVRDRSARLAITDIDHTIADAAWWEVLAKPVSAVPPVRGAVGALRDIAHDATIVYLTARDDGATARTKAWLRHHGFPPGPVFFSDDVRAWFDPRPYKSGVVGAIRAAFPNVPCGFGDLPGDAAAYHDHGLVAFIFDTHGAGPFPPYARVYRDWVALRAANAAGRHPALAWAARFR